VCESDNYEKLYYYLCEQPNPRARSESALRFGATALAAVSSKATLDVLVGAVRDAELESKGAEL